MSESEVYTEVETESSTSFCYAEFRSYKRGRKARVTFPKTNGRETRSEYFRKSIVFVDAQVY